MEIYDYFHANQACQKYFFDSAHEDEYVAYYNSMHLLHDSTESLWCHRRQGFARDPSSYPNSGVSCKRS